MDQHTSYPGDDSPTCSFGLMDCFSAQKREQIEHKRASRRIGVERQMLVTYNQPHLVEPMKLTVYDDLPLTPLPPAQSHISKIVSQGRRSMSRASTRASISTRRRANSKLSISNPLPIMPAGTVPLRRNLSFRPLQLSIYAVDQRLSDLPVFDRLSFTEDGSIKPPPRALIRTQSEELLRCQVPDLPDFLPGIGKPASMFEQSLSRRVSHVRRDTESSIVSSSRPASEYDALHSHPVSWYSVPGLPPQLRVGTGQNHSKTILSPMQEEFTPPPSGAVLINGKILAFPDIDASRVQTEEAYSSLLPPAPGQESESACPSPTIDPGPTRQTMVVTKHRSKLSQAATILLTSSANSTRTRTRTNTSASMLQPTASSLQLAQMPVELPAEQPRPYFHTNYATHSRINQWLDTERPKAESQVVEPPTTTVPTRSRDSSISTVKSGLTISTNSSFAEHRRKRSEFYQLNTKPTNPTTPTDNSSPASAAEASPKTYTRPNSLKLYKPFPSQTAVAGLDNAQLPPARIPATNTNTLCHRRSKSSFTLANTALTQSHSRTMTNSTIASTIETDVLFEGPESPEDSPEERFHSARALLQRHIAMASAGMRGDDADSMTTFDIKSRTGTVKSTATSASPIERPMEVVEEPQVEATKETISQGFNFNGTTPSPVTPGKQCDDIEKMMFEMCAQSGFRRVNVGIAF